MKEDILEQIGHDWIQQQNGKYVKTNLKYRPDINNHCCPVKMKS